MRVTIVSTVVTPIPTLAGAEALSRKKLTQDMTTIRLDGTYTWNIVTVKRDTINRTGPTCIR